MITEIFPAGTETAIFGPNFWGKLIIIGLIMFFFVILSGCLLVGVSVLRVCV